MDKLENYQVNNNWQYYVNENEILLYKSYQTDNIKIGNLITVVNNKLKYVSNVIDNQGNTIYQNEMRLNNAKLYEIYDLSYNSSFEIKQMNTQTLIKTTTNIAGMKLYFDNEIILPMLNLTNWRNTI